MMYLLDSSVLIDASEIYYPQRRFPSLWEWLVHLATGNVVALPFEIYAEIGPGDLADWLGVKEVKDALLLKEEADPVFISQVVEKGYAADLDEKEMRKIGRDPFLISYACAKPCERSVVTMEKSAPRRERANRKIPDVCEDLEIRCINLFELIDELDFTTDWRSR